jgi:hypothetical protein
MLVCQLPREGGRERKWGDCNGGYVITFMKGVCADVNLPFRIWIWEALG